MQEQLDISIFNKKGLSRKKTFFKRFIALKVELGELANEIKFFKYWKTDMKIDREKILNEAADCLHFILSLTIDYKSLYPKKGRNYYNFIKTKFNNFKLTDKDNNNLDSLFLKIYMLNSELHSFPLIVDNFIKICVVSKITKEELIDAYIEKNKVNYQRIASGY